MKRPPKPRRGPESEEPRRSKSDGRRSERGPSSETKEPATRAARVPSEPWQPAQLRIVGGELRGRRFHYSGDPRVRPMKDRVREALFNLLGPAVRGTHALDLFGGTGAIGFEAVSRGAVHATIVERHMPTYRAIRENAEKLQLVDRVDIHHADAFHWANRWIGPTDKPWVVFCSPPYRFYTEQFEDVQRLLIDLIQRATPGSQIAVEADNDACFAQLPHPDQWDVRTYAPAVLGILRIGSFDP